MQECFGSKQIILFTMLLSVCHLILHFSLQSIAFKRLIVKLQTIFFFPFT